MNLMFSVLIPAYNAEKTIKRCLDSLIYQDEQEAEFIIIDDGSEDNTFEILKEYQSLDKRVKCLYSQHSGISITRQKLIEMASGEYILFCDADDFFEKNAMKKIRRILQNNNSDVIFFGYHLVREQEMKSVKRRQLNSGQYTKNQWADKHINGLTDLYWSALWNKCYKRSFFFQQQEILFQNVMEDVIFNLEYLARCNSIYIFDEILYNYVQIGDSLTRGKKEDSSDKILSAFNTYIYLKNIAIKAYPAQVYKITEYTYIMMKKLLGRAKKVKNYRMFIQLSQNPEFIIVKKTIKKKRYILDVKILIEKIKISLKKLLF